MKTVSVHVNARSGRVACDVLGSFLKAQLRDETSPPRKAGFVAYDASHAEEVALRPFDQVAVQEVVRDESCLRTWLIVTHLYTPAECGVSDVIETQS
jgi:hypothetical protein